MLQWRVKELLIEKGYMHSHKWLLQRKISPELATKILHNKQQRVELRHLNNICEAAYCTPNDLFVWQPEVPAQFKPSHPMQALRARAIANINQKLKSLSPEQIQELNKIVDDMGNRQ